MPRTKFKIEIPLKLYHYTKIPFKQNPISRIFQYLQIFFGSFEILYNESLLHLQSSQPLIIY